MDEPESELLDAGATPAAQPCFFWRDCRNYAQLEKQGKSVCAGCAGALKGQTYPLRAGTRQPLYASDQEIVAALQMVEHRHPPSPGGP